MADSDAVRSQRVPNLKTAQTCVAFQDSGHASRQEKARLAEGSRGGLGPFALLAKFGVRAGTTPRDDPKRSVMCSKLTGSRSRHTPSDNHRFKRAAGFMIAPLAVGIVAYEWQLICPALVFAQYLDRQAWRRHAGAIEFR
jgi:hypothetical protein